MCVRWNLISLSRDSYLLVITENIGLCGSFMKGRYNWIISGPTSVRDNAEIVTVVEIQFEVLGNPLYFRKDEN